MKRLPNALSCLRIAIALTLPFITGRPFLFASAYLLCGVTDALDGYLARRFNAQSALGSRLDTIGDFVFFTAALFAIWPLLMGKTAILICIAVITAMRVSNIVITKIKFRQWSGMHTIGNKITGLLLFLVLPACVMLREIPAYLSVPVCAAALLSALEEGVILLTTDSYDPNRRSLFLRQKD